eukprot:CFRG6555T1
MPPKKSATGMGRMTIKSLKSALVEGGFEDKIVYDMKKEDLVNLYSELCTPSKKHSSTPNELPPTYTAEKRAGIQHTYSPSPIPPKNATHSIILRDSPQPFRAMNNPSSSNESNHLDTSYMRLRPERKLASRRSVSRQPSLSTVDSSRRSERRSVPRASSIPPHLQPQNVHRDRRSRESSRTRRSESVRRDLEIHDDIDKENEVGTDTENEPTPYKECGVERQSNLMLQMIYIGFLVGLVFIVFGLDAIHEHRRMSICVGRSDGDSPVYHGVCSGGVLTCAGGFELFEGKCLIKEDAQDIRLGAAADTVFYKLRRQRGRYECMESNSRGLSEIEILRTLNADFAMKLPFIGIVVDQINTYLCPRVLAKSTENENFSINNTLECVYQDGPLHDVFVDENIAILGWKCRFRRWFNTVFIFSGFASLLALVIYMVYLRRIHTGRMDREKAKALERLIAEAKYKSQKSSEPYLIIEEFKKDFSDLFQPGAVNQAVELARYDARVRTKKILHNGVEHRVLEWLDDGTVPQTYATRATESLPSRMVQTSFVSNTNPSSFETNPAGLSSNLFC